MKWRHLFTVLLVSSASICHSQVGDTTRRDSVGVQAFVRLSKLNQWVSPNRSLKFADKALALAQSLNYPEGIAMARNQKGFSYWSFGDNDLAIQEAMEGLDIARQVKSNYLQAESYYVLARGYMDIQERDKAWESITQAESLALSGNYWDLQYSIYNLMGVIQFIENRQDSALKLYNQAYDLGRIHHIDSINFPRIISNIGECYAVENPALAFSYFTKALSLAERTGNQIAKASITAIIGHAYLRSNDLKRAESNLTAALELARSLGLRRVVRHAYAGLVDIKLRQGKGNEAVVYQRRYYEVRDSLLNTSKLRQVVELESRHALQLKEQDIRILENEKQIQKIRNNLLIGLMALLVVLSVGVYLAQRYRYRKNRAMLDLEIDYLTRRNQEAEERIKASLIPDVAEPLESQDQQLLRKAIAVVESHMRDPLFSVEKMAEEMNMSRTGLHRKIKGITGFPPSELIRTMRLRKAAKLIKGKTDSISQIALQVGFDDYSHFSKSFKKQFGVAPTQYN